MTGDHTPGDERIILSRQWTAWRLHDSFTVVQSAPHVKDPKTGATVDPTSLTLEYGWSGGRWWLVAAEVSGPRIAEDGTYPDDPHIEIDFYDPVAGEEGAGKAPDWVLTIATRRIEQIPTPAPLPEGWNFST